MKDQEKINILTKALYTVLLQQEPKSAKIANDALDKVSNRHNVRLEYQIDKIYTSKFQTAEKFLLKEIVYKNDRKAIDHFKGIWINREHLGICPLGADRLINE